MTRILLILIASLCLSQTARADADEDYPGASPRASGPIAPSPPGTTPPPYGYGPQVAPPADPSLPIELAGRSRMEILNFRKSDLEYQRTNLLLRYTPGHPEVRMIDRQLKQLEAEIQQELARKK